MTALILSIIAIVVAVVSAVFTGIAAVATRRMQGTDKARRIDERRPKFTGEVRRHSFGAGSDLWLALLSDEPLADVMVWIASERGGLSQGVSFSLRGKGVRSVEYADAHDPLSGDPLGLKPGESVAWRVDVSDRHSDPLRLQITCRAGDGTQWIVPVSVDVRT